MIYKHIDGVDVAAIFSDCGKYRYRLDITLKNTNKTQTVCVVMQNPSVANSDIADKSVQFLEKLVFQKNITQFSNVRKIIITNQFAFIQTNNFVGLDSEIGEDNDKHIDDAVNEADIILIAWGSSNAFNDRKQKINEIIKAHNNKIVLQGKSHPSRASYENYV